MKTTFPSEENKAMAAMFKHMAEHGGGPAYPQQMEVGKADNGEPYVWFTIGLTKREKFAAMMMGSLISHPNVTVNPIGVSLDLKFKIAEHAIEFADALLQRLKK